MTMIPYDEALGKWALHKKSAVEQGKRLISAGIAAQRKDIWLRGDLMKDCNNRIEYTYCRECGSMHIRKTNLCRDRLCPVCNWRLSLQRIGDTLQVLDYLQQTRGEVRAAMLTLTVKNVPAAELGDTITTMLRGWDRLLKRRNVQKWVAGYARSLELTLGSDGSYHPHIHVFIIWAEGYKKDISQHEWTDMWKAAVEAEYKHIIVDIRSAYSRKKTDSEWEKLVQATLECTKYAVKSKALLAIPEHDLIAVADALKGRRLISYGGCIRQARVALRMPAGDEAAADVYDTSIECPKCGCTDTVIMAYHWAQSTGQYLLAPHPYDI